MKCVSQSFTLSQSDVLHMIKSSYLCFFLHLFCKIILLIHLTIPEYFQQIVVNQFSRVAQNDRCSFIGNVTLGSSISLSELRELYHVVV